MYYRFNKKKKIRKCTKLFAHSNKWTRKKYKVQCTDVAILNWEQHVKTIFGSAVMYLNKEKLNYRCDIYFKIVWALFICFFLIIFHGWVSVSQLPLQLCRGASSAVIGTKENKMTLHCSPRDSEDPRDFQTHCSAHHRTPQGSSTTHNGCEDHQSRQNFIHPLGFTRKPSSFSQGITGAVPCAGLGGVSCLPKNTGDSSWQWQGRKD